MIYLYLLLSLFSFSTQAQNLSELSKRISEKKLIGEKEVGQEKKIPKIILQEDKENSVIDYSNIKNVLKRDGLAGNKEKKQKELKKIKQIKSKLKREKYNYPKASDFWSFMSEYWLVKHAQQLQWDITRPEYGITNAFKNLLEQFGYYQKKFKILIVNSPDITHMGLPSNKGEIILLLSLPFMRTIDLTKVDISLLLFEDFFRVEEIFFVRNIKADLKFLGANFADSKLNLKNLKAIEKEYNRIIFKSGFTFQQQYKITKQMDRVLKTNPGLWSAYIKVLNKVDHLIKRNLLYKNYNNIYPSPELQIKWLTPKKKVI